MKTSSKRLLLIMGGLGLLVATLYVYVSLLLPSYQDVQRLRGELASKTGIVQNEINAEDKVKKLLETYKSLSKIEELFSLILPSKPEIPALLNQIDGISRINNISIDGTTFNFLALRSSKTTTIKPLGTVRMNLTFHGRYEDLKKFVNDLETNIRLIDINSLKVDGGGVPNKDILNYNLEADAYYQPGN